MKSALRCSNTRPDCDPHCTLAGMTSPRVSRTYNAANVADNVGYHCRDRRREGRGGGGGGGGGVEEGRGGKGGRRGDRRGGVGGVWPKFIAMNHMVSACAISMRNP